MKLERYRWVEMTRRDLFTLISARGRETLASASNASKKNQNGIILAGFNQDSDLIYRSAPSVIIVDDDECDDLLAWFYSFAADFMPLSMYFKVILASDFRLVKRPPPLREISSSLWSSIIFGEYLMRGRSSKVLKDFYVGWIETSCTHSYFIMFQNFDENIETKNIFSDRLKELQSNSRFSFPTLDLDDLEVFWNICQKADKLILGKDSQNPYNIASTFSELFDSETGIALQSRVSPLLGNSNFESDSVERRLKAFDLVISECASSKSMAGISAGFCVGVAAFLVGRGTSHLRLIDRIAPTHPTAFLWFSAMAGLCGSRVWDPRWFELMKRIQPRLIGSDPECTPGFVDLSWLEYKWLNEASKSSAPLKELVRNTPNSLTVEIFPKIPFQIRFSRDPSEPEKPSQGSVSPETTSETIIRNIETLLKDFVKVGHYSSKSKNREPS